MTPNQSIEIFFSYSQADEKLRDELATHLSGLKREGVIKDWYESKISAGKERAKEIEKNLNSASVILLLISSDFINSEELWEIEVTRAMEKHNKQEARVIPVLLRSCVWDSTPFGKLEPLPTNKVPITSWSNKDEAFTNVVHGIQQAVKEISGIKELADNSQLQKTKRRRQFQIPWRSVFTILPTSIGLTFLVIVMRVFGMLQASELWFFDQMMQFQPNEEQDDHLLVVEITKKDIDAQTGTRQGSLTDETLLKLLKQLLKNQPQAIGLDIHRDFKTETKELSDLLTRNPNIFAVCNVGDQSMNNLGVKPPPEIPRERLGFSDFLQDSEGIVRRQLLSVDSLQASPCWSNKKLVNNALSLELARHYLKDKNKPYEEPVKDGKVQLLRFGSTAFEPLYTPNVGGYWISDLEGYQVLLNYRRSCSDKDKNKCSPEFVAKRVTAEDVQKPDFLERYPLKDKIVLIGVTDNSYEPPWFTPFSSGGTQPQTVPGVVMQAQMVSQILSAVLDQRPLLQVWSIWYEMLWILFWSLVGGTIAQFYRSPKSLIVSGGIAFTSLYLLCLVFFISPSKRWIPFVPPTLTLLCTGGVVVFIKFRVQKSSF